ncbi:hypothetical protein [Marinobacterium iners]|uniref:Uncharacterized protein n=1 Tax=Marinobacterium iners DSM 11526 TaxID=1122198 RepID=A0A1H3XBY6_9GAMM|nr:hypothetical protein [Marinobacterium iners]SDZ96122.1 hypothetical protein SAMN02745729_10186 [Marinobacterium iners DSM 11526]
MHKRKLRNRALRIEMPTGKTCPECKGSGARQGLVSEYSCPRCHGLGVIELRQDYFADKADALSSMCIAQRRRIKELEQQLAASAEKHIGSRFD